MWDLKGIKLSSSSWILFDSFFFFFFLGIPPEEEDIQEVNYDELVQEITNEIEAAAEEVEEEVVAALKDRLAGRYQSNSVVPSRGVLTLTRYTYMPK